jgi:hypothetical protein
MPSDNPATVSAPSSSPSATESKPGYEFTAEQNTVIGNLGTKMKLVGLVLLIFGALNLINAFLVQILFTQLANENVPVDVRDQLSQIGKRDRWVMTGFVTVIGIVLLCVGAWTRSAGDSFSRLAVASGKDINQLMEGFGLLHKMYSLIATALVAAIVAYLILVIVKTVQM